MLAILADLPNLARHRRCDCEKRPELLARLFSKRMFAANETQYFADPFEPSPSRAHLVERAG
jgi:hypothetical protein